MKKVRFLTPLFAVVIGNAWNPSKDKLTIPKGRWNVGGNLTFNTFKNTANKQPLIRENKTISFTALPNIGYSIAENTILGLRFGYSFQNTENSFIEGKTINHTILH